nr:transposase [Streptomyces sp. GS7]
MLKPLLPRGKGPGRPPKHTKRRLIDGIRWRTRTGVPWQNVQPYYGPWRCVYWLYRRWQLDGVWYAILTTLQVRADAAGLVTWDMSVDSAITAPMDFLNQGRPLPRCPWHRPGWRVANNRLRVITRVWRVRGRGG